MDQHLLINISPSELKEIVKVGIKEALQEHNNAISDNKTYSISQASKLLRRHFCTVKKLVISGKLKTTSDGQRILAHSIEEYLNE